MPPPPAFVPLVAEKSERNVRKEITESRVAALFGTALPEEDSPRYGLWLAIAACLMLMLGGVAVLALRH